MSMPSSITRLLRQASGTCKCSGVTGKALQSAATLQRSPFWQPYFAQNRSAALQWGNLQSNVIGHMETLSGWRSLPKETLHLLESFFVVPKVSHCLTASVTFARYPVVPMHSSAQAGSRI